MQIIISKKKEKNFHNFDIILKDVTCWLSETHLNCYARNIEYKWVKKNQEVI